MVNLSFQQKAAIRDFLNHITSSTGMMKWDKNKLLSVFEDYGLYGAQNETYIEGWEKKTSNLLIYKRLCKI